MSLTQGAIIGITVPSVIVGLGFIYMCCCRKEANARSTQKLMDATNLMHAQEPLGLMSTGVLPDGTVGLLVRPLPSSGVLPSQPQQLPIQPQQQLPYQPFVPPAPQPYAVSAPSAPFQQDSYQPADLQHQLQLSSHPRPNVVTTTGSEIKAGVNTPYVSSSHGHGHGSGSMSGPVSLSPWTSPAPPVTTAAGATTLSLSGISNYSKPTIVRGPEERHHDTQPFYSTAPPTSPFSPATSFTVNSSVEKATMDTSYYTARPPNNPHGPI
ncbi:hypothetical protein EC957_000145 [Mortierella hygrophila]|uniref:Uncharacterized protein n=1 Tax=Mortierella hygrophila TaxID=979708 RepID=A0A9P6K7U1_9FUNG|nr:hypothetical protein EC957_000145 [Mortierella hygrophila]